MWVKKVMLKKTPFQQDKTIFLQKGTSNQKDVKVCKYLLMSFCKSYNNNWGIEKWFKAKTVNKGKCNFRRAKRSLFAQPTPLFSLTLRTTFMLALKDQPTIWSEFNSTTRNSFTVRTDISMSVLSFSTLWKNPSSSETKKVKPQLFSCLRNKINRLKVDSDHFHLRQKIFHGTLSQIGQILHSYGLLKTLSSWKTSWIWNFCRSLWWI